MKTTRHNTAKNGQKRPFEKQKRKTNSPEKDTTTRLNKYIANTGLCSRRDADELIKGGKISVNGKIVTEMGIKVDRSDTVKYKGKNIAEILDMSVEDALQFFRNIPSVFRKLTTLCEVGLGYIRLGQQATTLSGGEAQRVKLATELSKVGSAQTIYILDEPTTGLHFADIKMLLKVLQTLVERGNTVIVIEHNLDVIKCADWVIDLGPEGGDAGGEVIFTGVPEDLVKYSKSYTGKFLKGKMG